MTASLERLDPNDVSLLSVVHFGLKAHIQPDLGITIDKLKETHATSAGLKAFCTWAYLDTIDKCRQSLGGHGYSAYSNLPGMYADFTVQW